MTKVLDDLCNYRRYCWNQGLELWYELYNQRIEMVPANLRKKLQLAIKDKTIVFSEGEQGLLNSYPTPSNCVVRDLLVKNKEDWQYLLSSRVLQLAVKDLSIAWSTFFDSRKSSKKENERSENLPFVTRKIPNKVLKQIELLSKAENCF